MARMFVALPGNKEGLVQAAAEYRKQVQRLCWDAANFTEEPTLHLTLRFLGDVDRDLGRQMVSQLWDISIQHNPVRLRVSGLGMFDGNSAVVAWLTGDLEALAQLQEDVDAAARALRVPPADYPFTPHITLGRLTGDPDEVAVVREALPDLETVPAELWANDIALYESVRQDTGRVFYIPNGTFWLRALGSTGPL